MGKLRIQIYCSIIVIIIFFPMAYLLSNYFRTNGILITICISLLLSTLFQTIQLKKILNKNAIGIWNK